MISKLTKAACTFLVIAAVSAAGFSFASQNEAAETAFGGGAAEIHAGANLNGCVTGNGVTIPFTTNGSGIAYVSGLSAGTYSVCVENWGATTFYSDGASEIPVTVPNNVDCSC